MKTAVVYHQVKSGVDCADGIASAWVAKKKYPDAVLYGQTYDEPQNDLSRFDRIIYVDFSVPAYFLRQSAGCGIQTIVVDHHKTAQENLHGLLSEQIECLELNFDIAECGATLTWRRFFPDKPLPKFLEYVRDRDLWEHKLPHTEEIHEAIANIRYQKRSSDRKEVFEFFDSLESNWEDELPDLIKLGEDLLAPKRKAVAGAAQRVQFGIVAGWGNIPYVATAKEEDRLVSDICSVLYKRFPDALFVACFTTDGTWSLRSDKDGNDTDVGAIAKSQGGGGHRNASGFKL